MATMAGVHRGHVIALTMSAWGHAKSACSLLSKIVRQRPVHATFFIASSLSEKAIKEVDSQFVPGAEDDLRKLVRIVALECSPNPFDFSILDASFIKEYKKLLEPKSSSGTSNDMSKPGPPQLIILDFFMFPTLQSIRSVSGHTIPVYALESGAITAVFTMFGPGGRLANLSEEMKAIPFIDKEAIAEEAGKIYIRVDGRVIKVPGLPPMYDHEQIPQTPVIPELLAFMLDHAQKFIAECDGAVINSTRVIEGESIRAFQKWFGERPAVCVGPFDYPVVEQPKAADPNIQEVESFLNTMLEKYGHGSVVYVSLGSQFWPSEPEKLWAILDVMIEQKVPFILAHAAPFAVVPDEINEKIKASELGYSSTWLPQITILNHKACGWMLTHAGQNSVTEALSAGIPMICWPFDADQPVNAASIAFVHNLGYELFEVRTGVGLRPIHRLGDWKPEGTVESVKREFSETIEKMKGEDGASKRANVQKFRDALAKLWAPGGENWQEIKKISDILQ